MRIELLIYPKNWSIFIGYFLLRLLLLLPYSVLMFLGSAIGHVGYYFPTKRKTIIKTNIQLCFPELSKEQKKKLIKENIISTAKTLFETALAYWASDKKLKNLAEIHGIRHLKKALKENRGALVLSCHFTFLDLALRLLNMELDEPVYMMYRAHNHPLIEYLIMSGRKKHCANTIGKKDVGELYQCLNDNHAVWYAPDQNFSYHNVFVPFFGIQAATVTGTSRIAKESQAKIIPFFFYRKEKNQGYLLELLPALEEFPSGDDEKDTTRINLLFEKAIKKHPEQYLWAHRRFKTRPEGEPKIYPPRKRKKRRKKSSTLI